MFFVYMRGDIRLECGGHRTFQADVFDEVRAALGDITGPHNSDSSVRASGGLLRGKGGTRLQTGIGGSSGRSRAWRRTRSCWLSGRGRSWVSMQRRRGVVPGVAEG